MRRSLPRSAKRHQPKSVNETPTTRAAGRAAQTRTSLVVNADDYGLTAGVNRAIEEAHLAGFVTSTTVIVAGEMAGEVSELHRTCEAISIGLHVNLTLGRPTTDPSRVPTLVGSDGRFHSRASLAKLLLRRQVASQDISLEAAAQIEALDRLGVTPTHWDTHQHVAELPPIARAIGAAARSAGILRARTPRVWIVNGSDGPFVARWRWRTAHPRRVAGDASRAIARNVVSRDFLTPDFRAAANLVVAPEATYAERWEILLSNLPAGTCEITTHPGHVDDRLRELTPRLTTERTTDLEVAMSARTKVSLRDARVILIPFAQVGSRA